MTYRKPWGIPLTAWYVTEVAEGASIYGITKNICATNHTPTKFPLRPPTIIWQKGLKVL